MIKSLTDADFKKYGAAREGRPWGPLRTRLDRSHLNRRDAMLIALLQAIVSGLAVGGAYALIALGFSITFTTTKTLELLARRFRLGRIVHRRNRAVAGAWQAYQCARLCGVTLSVLAATACRCCAVVVMGLLGVLLYFLAVRRSPANLACPG